MDKNGAIDASLVERIAHLARLPATPAEIEILQDELGRILDFVAELDAVDVTNIPATCFGRGCEARFRPDFLRLKTSKAERMANAPDVSEGAFQVPRVLG